MDSHAFMFTLEMGNGGDSWAIMGFYGRFGGIMGNYRVSLGTR